MASMYNEDSPIDQITDPRPEDFPESCRETIVKFQQLDKLSDAELDLVVSYELLRVKAAGQLTPAMRVSPADLGERMAKLFLSKQSPSANGTVRLWEVILAQRQFVNDACFLYGRGSMPTIIEPVIEGIGFIEDAHPLDDKSTYTKNKLKLKQLLMQWPQKYKPPADSSHRELFKLASRATLSTEDNVEEWDGLLTHADPDIRKSAAGAEKANNFLANFVAGFVKHLWPLSRGMGISVDDLLVIPNVILDDLFDLARKGNAIAFLTLEKFDEPLCLYISPGMAAEVADAFIDADRYQIDGEVRRFIIEHLYEAAGGFLRDAIERILELRTKRYDICINYADAADLFSEHAAVEMVDLHYGLNFGEPNPDYPAGHPLTIAIPVKLLKVIKACKEIYSSP